MEIFLQTLSRYWHSTRSTGNAAIQQNNLLRCKKKLCSAVKVSFPIQPLAADAGRDEFFCFNKKTKKKNPKPTDKRSSRINTYPLINTNVQND